MVNAKTKLKYVPIIRQQTLYQFLIIYSGSTWTAKFRQAYPFWPLFCSVYWTNQTTELLEVPEQACLPNELGFLL